MPYPPPRPRKHPDLPPRQAAALHLQPYQFQPGQSGNPGGMSKTQRELYLEAKGLAHRAGPLAIARLVELAGIDLEAGELVPRVVTDDSRVMYVAAVALAERVYGKPAVSGPEPEQSESVAATLVRHLSADERAQLRAMIDTAQARAAAGAAALNDAPIEDE